MTRILILSLMFAALQSTGCETIEYKKPEGFAEYKREGKQIKAISADGVVIKVKMIKNDPHGNSPMWMESVNLYLKSKGYKKLTSREISARSSLKGIYTEYIYRHYGRNYIYSLTLFADSDQLYLVESGGIENYYKKRRESILAAIKSLKKGD
jgi:hypothetical protein